MRRPFYPILLESLFVCLLFGGMSCWGQATQIEFVQGIPTQAGKDLSIYLDVCATDVGSVVDQSYAANISLTNNGGVAYAVLPSASVPPTDGCVRFQIIPTDTGTLNVNASSGAFGIINTGNIDVDTFDVPSTSLVGEIFYPGNDKPNLATYQALADTLNDAWERRVGFTCNDSIPNSFSPVFGDIAFNSTTYDGSITDLTFLDADTIVGVPYTGSVSFQVVNMKGPEFATIKGEKHTSGLTFLSNSQVLQDSAPMPFSLIPTNNERFTEVTGDFSSRNGLRFSFSPAVTQFGMWIGDVETNPNTTPGELVLFYGDVELRRDTIPTNSTPAQQSNTPAACGSYPGCGNQGTLWLEFYGAEVTDMLIVVGDDNSAGFGGFGGSEHLSFVGATMGGDCLLSPQAILNLGLKAEMKNGKIMLSWTSPQESEGLVFEIERGKSREKMNKIGWVKADGSFSYQFSDLPQQGGSHFYRLKLRDKLGGIGFSEVLQFRRQATLPIVFAQLPHQKNQQLQFGLFSEGPAEALLEVIDLQGRKVWVHKMLLDEGLNEQVIPSQFWPTGLYVASLKTPYGYMREKFWWKNE